MSAQQVCAVIVTYNPDLDRVHHIVERLGDTIGGVVIVDNASAGSIEQTLAGFPRTTLKRLPENRGIAAAQNEGVAIARQRGYPYILFLDQDSLPDERMLDFLLNAMVGLESQGVKVCCVGPRIRSRHDGSLNNFTRITYGRVRVLPCEGEDMALECDYLISSGSLVPTAVFADVGGLEEKLFIDQVDSEWCLRARAKGYRVFGACGAILEHRLGESWGRMWLGRWRYQPRHKPFRYYYIFRNTILVCRRSYIPLRIKLFNLKWLTLLFLMWGVFARRRHGELGMMLKGIAHGLRGITGKLAA